MAKKTKKKSKAQETSAIIEGQHMKLVTITVDDPYFDKTIDESRTNTRKVTARFNMKESYAGYLFNLPNGGIDAGQKLAADKVRAAFERMGGAGAQAMDYSRTKVDGGQIAQTISEQQMDASRVLKECSECLGPEGHDLVIKLAAEGRWPKDLWPNHTQHYRNRKAEAFKQCLTALSLRWGYRSKVRAMRVA